MRTAIRKQVAATSWDVRGVSSQRRKWYSEARPSAVAGTLSTTVFDQRTIPFIDSVAKAQACSRPAGRLADPASGPRDGVDTRDDREQHDQRFRDARRRSERRERKSFENIKKRRVRGRRDHRIPSVIADGERHRIAWQRSQQVPPEQAVDRMSGRITLEPKAIAPPMQDGQEKRRHDCARDLGGARIHAGRRNDACARHSLRNRLKRRS